VDRRAPGRIGRRLHHHGRHVAAMGPPQHRRAHPVGLGGSDDKKAEQTTMLQKLENDTAAFVKGIAERRPETWSGGEGVRQSESGTPPRRSSCAPSTDRRGRAELLARSTAARSTWARRDAHAAHCQCRDPRLPWAVKEQVCTYWPTRIAT